MLDGASLVGILASAFHLALLAYSVPGTTNGLEANASAISLTSLEVVEPEIEAVEEEVVVSKAVGNVDRARPSSGFSSTRVFSRSCAGKCGTTSPVPGLPCQCHNGCLQAGNCCPDFTSECHSCKNRCGDRFDRHASCQCNSHCHQTRDCCPDFSTACRSLAQSQTTQRPTIASSNNVKCKNSTLPTENVEGNDGCKKKRKNKRRKHKNKKRKKNNGTDVEASITEDELLQLSNELFQLDAKNPFASPLISLQGKTRSGSQNDLASQPLFGPQTASEAVTSSTHKLLSDLYDNYNPEVGTSEQVTPEHLREEQVFFEAVMATKPMKRVISLLVARGLLPSENKTMISTLRTLWFERFSRSPGATGSSGFEHVFLGEVKNAEPSGFHSWLFFRKEERLGALDYLGFSRSAKLSEKATLVELPLKWKGLYKPINTMFIGTSPELEMALYTLSFYARPEAKCPMNGGGFKFFIQTFPFKSRGKVFLGTAYPTFN